MHVIPQDDNDASNYLTDQDDVSLQPSDPVQKASDEASIDKGVLDLGVQSQMPPSILTNHTHYPQQH